MKILYCVHNKIDPRLGGPKVYIENSQGFKKLGWDITMISPDNLQEGLSSASEEQKVEKYTVLLKDYLIKNADKYDVVEYEHNYLPYERSLFPKNTLMVARSVLLLNHLKYIQFPNPPGLINNIKAILKFFKPDLFFKKRLHLTNLTLKNADYINVVSDLDKECLLREGYPDKKIGCYRYGIDLDRLVQLNVNKPEDIENKEIVFVGSFIPRKGSVEFPQILKYVFEHVENVKVKLLGTVGSFSSIEEFKSYLGGDPKRIEIVQSFKAEDLPILLKGASIGIFPTHLESFGFGILEMMAASIPVLSYNVPGPPLMIDEDLLFKRGDWKNLAIKLSSLLNNSQELIKLRKEVREKAQELTWDEPIKAQSDKYLMLLEEMRK